MLETARLVETEDAPRNDAENELPELRLLVAAESEVEPRAPPEFPAGVPARELAEVLEFAPPRAVFAPDAPKCALEGGVTPARLPAP